MKKSKLRLVSICFLVLLLNSRIAFAQSNMEDVVYLKNGSIIHGMIIEQIPNQTIKIQTVDKSVFVFKVEEVSKITKEPVSGKSKTKSKNKSGSSGTFIAGDFGFAPGVGNISATYNGQHLEGKNEDYIISFQFILGGRLSEGLCMGVGIGLDRYKQTSVLPIFLDLRGDLGQANVRPVLIGDIGYAFEVGGNNSGPKGKGLMVNPALGIKFDTGGAMMTLSFGYRIQTLNYDNSSYGNSDSFSETADFFTIKLGVSSF